MDPRRPRQGVGRIRFGAGGVAAAAGIVAVLVAGAFLFGQPSTGPAGLPSGSQEARPTPGGSVPGDGSLAPVPATVEPSPSPSPSGEALLSLPIEKAPGRGPDLTARENSRRGTDRWELPLT